MTFKQKLNMSYTLIIIILISIITYSHYLIHLANTKNNLSMTMNELSNQLVINLDAYLSGLVASTMKPLYEREQVERLIAGKSFSDLTLLELNQMENYIRYTYLYPNTEDITAVHLFSNNMESISLYQKGQRYASVPETSPAYQQAIDASGAYVISDTYLAPSFSSSGPLPLFSIYRQLNITELNKRYAMLVLDIKLTKLDELLQNISIGQDSYVTIVNEQNEIVYSTDKQEITMPAPTHSADQWLQTEASLKTVPWKLKLEVPVNSVLNRKEMLLNSVLIMSAAILTAILFSGWFSRKITLPLEQLQRLMRRAESGEFNLRFQTKARDEIFHLGNSFNQMLIQIKILIDRTYVAEIRQRDAQFSALQSQISPHFLFNTLETIRMTAETEGNLETVRMITSLGKLLKVNIKQQRWVTLQQELDYVQHYLYLQSVRLNYPPQIVIDCEKSLENISVHALMIQPLVENSILHGLRPVPRSGFIKVEAKSIEVDSIIEITVADDGAGIPPERLEQLQHNLQSSHMHSDQEDSIGIINVQRRIQLSYGKEFGLRIHSVEGAGTSVICRIPLITTDNKNEIGEVDGHEYISHDYRR